jgi:hypothetical protein
VFAQIEREVWAAGRTHLRYSLQARLEAFAAQHAATERPRCCGRAMHRHDRRRVRWLTWVGPVSLLAWRYRCGVCRAARRPLVEMLDIEPGQPSGLLARMLALFGTVAAYPLAAELVTRIVGLEVNAMTVWRAVQRLGEAAARHTDALSAYHSDRQPTAPEPAAPPATVVVAGDGCTLGMQVRSTRRRAPSTDAPLPPVEDGHFREVKTGVLLQPTERVEPSPGRRSLVRGVLVTCLGDADALFSRLWAALRERGWLGPETIVVVIGDGSEWIWKRAALFVRRCEMLDFWHAMSDAWAYARVQFGEGSRRGETWVRRIACDLKAGEVHAVIARLRTLHPDPPKVAPPWMRW